MLWLKKESKFDSMFFISYPESIIYSNLFAQILNIQGILFNRVFINLDFIRRSVCFIGKRCFHIVSACPYCQNFVRYLNYNELFYP